MRTTLALIPIALLSLGCAGHGTTTGQSTPQPSARNDFPLGNDAEFRSVAGVALGAPGHLRLVSRDMVYAVFLELRPTFDSLDVRLPVDVDADVVLNGTTELEAPMETVDGTAPSTASRQAVDCSTVKMGAGDPTGQEVCPVSRGNLGDGPIKWGFRNRVFLLLSDRAFTSPLPKTIAWSARRTVPPVEPGSKWTAIALQ